MRAAFPALECGDGKDLAHEIDVPRTGKSDSLRKTGCAGRDESVQRLFVKHHRNPEAAVFDHMLLNRIGENRSRARSFAEVRRRFLLGLGCALAGATHLSEPELEKLASFLIGGEVAVFIGQQLPLIVHPHRLRLRNLLFERHAAQEIRDALVHGQARIAIRQL